MKGTIELRRRFRGIGELRVASGTTDKKLAKALDAMLLTLANGGRLDVLRALHQRRLAPLEVWERYRVGELKKLPSAAALKRLAPTWERWVKTFRVSEGHRRDSRMYGERLASHAGRGATVRDLPKALNRYRDACEASGKAVSFNRCRAAAQAFLRDTAGKNDEIYLEIKAIGTLSPGPRKVKGGQTPESAVLVARSLATDPAILWLQMCLSGMGPGELEGKWGEEGEDGLRIHGTKRESRDRLVPRLFEVVKIACRAQTLRKALRKMGEGLTPYDGRRTYAHWMEGAGIPRTRRRLYMGHKAGDVTDLYEEHDVAGFLPADRERLTAHAAAAVDYLTELLTDGPEDDSGDSVGAPPWNRTKNLLIKSHRPARQQSGQAAT